MKKLSFLVFIVMITSCLSLQAQGWERIYGGDQISAAQQILPTDDGNYLVDGFTGDGLGSGIFGTFILKINPEGEVIWQKIFPATTTSAGLRMTKCPGDTYVMESLHTEIRNGRAINVPKFTKFTTNGEILWEKILFENSDKDVRSWSVFCDDQGDLTFSGSVGASSPLDYYLGKMSANGDFTSWIPLDNSVQGFGMIENNNGGYYFVDSDSSTNELVLHEISDAGTYIQKLEFPGRGRLSLRRLLDTDELICTQTGGDGKSLQYRLSLDNNLIDVDTFWDQGIVIPNGVILQEDGMIYSGSTDPSDNDPENDLILIKVQLDGTVQWSKIYKTRPGTQRVFDGVVTPDGGVIGVGDNNPRTGDAPSVYLVKVDENGNIYTNVILGTTAIDSLSDCLISTEDFELEDMIIEAAKSDGTRFVSSTDQFGQYSLPVDTGDYIVKLFLPNTYLEPCANNIPVSITGVDNEILVDFPLTPMISCPAMTVSGTTFPPRPCFERPSFVRACNYGTTIAEDAYVEITYDSLMVPVSSSIPFVALSGNRYRFELGDLAPFECVEFQVGIFLDCEAEVGAAFCLEAHAFPDTLCEAIAPGWTGAFLEASGGCDSTEVVLRLQNTGSSPMSNYVPYIIVEDAILMKRDSVILEPGEIESFPFPATGSSYTLLSGQVPDAPGETRPIAFVEGCTDQINEPFSTGFANQFAQNDANPYFDIDCPISVASFDPNDKRAAPEGYEAEHFIDPGTPLEYVIRFQNTGTDTAFSVILRDTLDPWLDIESLEVGVSSHDYDFEITGQGVLIFRYVNIMLPDSNVNEPASHGFVEFRIRPRDDTPLGTIIRNDAAIYFDFNEPIFTNETFHTIAEDFIEVVNTSTSHPSIKNVKVLVKPNPFLTEAVFEILNHQVGAYQFELYDIRGRLIRREQHTGFQIHFQRKDLPAGMYFYQIMAKDGFLNTGKVMVR